MKVFVSACGEGLGHTARVLALRKALERAGHETVLAGYGPSLEVMRKAGAKTFETFPEVKMKGKGGRFNLVSSILRSYDTPLDLMRSYMRERWKIGQMRADAVVSDSRLSTVIAGSIAGLPTFYVTNQSEFQLPRLPVVGSRRLRVLRILSKAQLPAEAVRRMVDMPLSVPYSFSDQVLIPDFTPPNTICLPLLSKDLEMKKKTFFMGPMNELCFGRPKPAKWSSRKAKVLVTFGGQQFRAGLLGDVVKAAKKMPEFEFMIAGMFVKTDADVGNLRLRKFLPEVAPYAAAADFLVIPAGHSSIMEAILLEKPAIIVPDKGQPEQESNARMCHELGLGRMLPVDRLNELNGALEKLKTEEEKHRAKLRRLADAARSSENGALNAVRMVEEFVERIRY